jgi:hypothetical protein
MKSLKYLEYRARARFYSKYMGNYNKLSKIIYNICLSNTKSLAVPCFK